MEAAQDITASMAALTATPLFSAVLDATPPEGPRRMTEAPAERSEQRAVCACTRGCTTTQCACRKTGAGCKVTCACVTRGYCRSDPCQSPFSQLWKLFGEELRLFRASIFNFRSRDMPECDVRASPCFTRHLNFNPRTPRKLDTQCLEAKIMQDSGAWRLDPALTGMRREFDRIPDEDLGTRRKLIEVVMIYAMGVEDEPSNKMQNALDSPNIYAWSFCKDKWVSRHRTVHCKHCDVCYDLAWHCERCGTCKAGRASACDGCGGWSKDGIWNGEDGPKAPDAHKAQRGLSQLSPRKRARSLEVWNDSISETVPQAPDDIATRSCACKDACSSRRCLCRRWGGSCKESCKCKGQHCGNEFRANGFWFGEAYSDSRATHCFADYVEKAEKIDYRRPFHDNGASTHNKNLEALLTADHQLFDESDELREWKDKLNGMGPEFEARMAHLRWLFRLGLSISEGKTRFYSFCLKQWTDEDTHRHCPVCKRCCSVKTSWHCGVCRQCRHGGLDETCFRCGGRSLTAMSKEEKENEFWRNEMMEPTGPSLRVVDDDSISSDLDIRTSIEVRDDASNSGPAVNNSSADGIHAMTAFACDPCRHHKVKCDGVRSICARCVARGDQSCVYRL